MHRVLLVLVVLLASARCTVNIYGCVGVVCVSQPKPPPDDPPKRRKVIRQLLASGVTW